jgi:hypothetical protein
MFLSEEQKRNHELQTPRGNSHAGNAADAIWINNPAATM